MNTIAYLARICMNTNAWREPSGARNKSTSNESFEKVYGFGFEEWLFDDKVIDGYHYGFLQPILTRKRKYAKVNGQYDIHLYTLNAEDHTRYYIGKIHNVEFISEEDASMALKTYERNGWFEEMKEQLKQVNANWQKLEDSSAYECFNIRFKPSDVEVDLSCAYQIADGVIKSDRYNLKTIETEKLLLNRSKVLPESIGRNPGLP